SASDMESVTLSDRFRGSLVGLATGDAVGTTLEFQEPGTFAPIADMVGGGPFSLEAGQWTDDTSMAMCLADSLLATGGFDADDQMRRYVRWWRHGYRSSTGKCFDIGSTVRRALTGYESTGDPFSGPTDEYSAGNGSLMRIVPIAMRFYGVPGKAVEWAAESSRTTHGAPAAVDACRYFVGLLVGVLGGQPREQILSARYRPSGEPWMPGELVPEVFAVADGSFKVRMPPEIRGTGYVVKSLEAALWAFHHASDFRDGCLLAANLGDDADTTAAIYGQIAGAYWGINGIPSDWRRRLAMLDEILETADGLLAAAQS
ncbi:MAG: ADP-ribosylglycohydrolase family protein, partial [Rhodothermales bacterium]|nr:ADP-ribosylglycohydrolase family protein [Rhodothermales bacterium]